MGLLGRNKSKSPGREQVKVNASDRYNAMHDPPPPPPTPPPSTSSRRSRPSSRGSSSSRPRGNATSTAGYQYALQAYSKTVDPNENSNVNTMPSIVTKNQSTANAFVRQSQHAQGTSVPASLLTSNGNINARATNAYSRGNANRNGNRNNASPPQETLNAVHGGACLTYSNSGSPDKTGYQHQQLNQQQQQDYNRHNSNYNNEYMQPQTQPQQQQPQPQPQHHLNINTNPNPILRSSSSMDDCGPPSDDDINPISPASSSSYSFPQYPGSPSTFLHQRKSNSKNHNHNHSHSNSFLPDYNYEPEMVDTTYAEHYGDAYTGKPIRYIYPQGYGSMRPRSRPWQIALVMFIALAWLNVYIVGHCADRFESQNYNDDQYQNANDNDNYNANDADDAAVIETKWCGNRNLYFTWVLSVALTGLSFAYCSIIGYVKARDFAVANGRSQPPGMVGKSDYYVQEELGSGAGLEAGVNFGNINANANTNGNAGSGFGGNAGEGGIGVTSYQNGAGVKVKQTIYQADGTPRFFGGQIYRPTQAAVSLTSR